MGGQFMQFAIRFVVRRLVRLVAAAAIVPMVGLAAVKLADRVERDSGASSMTRILRDIGGRASYRRP